MSETLRWILIGFSVVLLVGIYWWGRRGGQSTSDDEVVRIRPEPTMPPAESDDDFVSSEPLETDAPQYERGDEAWAITASRPSRARDPVDEEEIQPAPQASQEEARGSLARRPRVEPTFGEVTAELPTHDVVEPVASEDVEEIRQPAPSPPETAERPSAEHAPTLAMSSTPPPKRIERRKIIALRLAAAPQRFEGAKLRAALEGESLQHGKYQVFHRMHGEDASIFSVASMVEPGTFEVSKMGENYFPGVTLFAQLPGPVPGMHALNELVACARRLHQTLGGTLQDDRGVPLTVHRIERLRQEIREFERPASAAAGTVPHTAER